MIFIVVVFSLIDCMQFVSPMIHSRVTSSDRVESLLDLPQFLEDSFDVFSLNGTIDYLNANTRKDDKLPLSTKILDMAYSKDLDMTQVDYLMAYADFYKDSERDDSGMLAYVYFQLVEYSNPITPFMDKLMNSSIVNEENGLHIAILSKPISRFRRSWKITEEYLSRLLVCGDVNLWEGYLFKATPFMLYLKHNEELLLFDRMLELADFSRYRDMYWHFFFRSLYSRTHKQFQMFVKATEAAGVFPSFTEIEYVCTHSSMFEYIDLVPYLAKLDNPARCTMELNE